MLTIQEVGTEIINMQPRSLYFMTGPEYGIKMKYIDFISELYPERIEASSIQEVLNMMSKKRIVPLKPAVYIIRYDEAFISALDESLAAKVKSTKICGTIVGIYDDIKHVNKLSKYLPDYTVSIDKVSTQFILKYLHADYPNLPDRFLNIVSQICNDYFHAKVICNAMSYANLESLCRLQDDEIKELFGVESLTTDAAVRLGVASRNFKYLNDTLDSYEGELDKFIYTMMSTLLEIEKLLYDKRIQSDIRKYVNMWSLQDVYNMFMNTYQELMKLRTIAREPKNCIIYLISLLQFQQIPSVDSL